ncbi:cytochrome c oxidase subunit 7A1, mitochondrial isoform X2 [Piliocolobus tephrosceles]|nr:cytochrome c oxidase subunit 7A1, mitochondrial isoform X2 [Piliocolobus tephrosceles]
MRIAARGEGLDRFLLGGRIEQRDCPHPSPSPAESPAVTLRAAGGVWGSWTGEGNACPWAERRGDSSGRGRGRMQALRVSRALIRSFSSTARNRFQNRVPEKQKLFQEDNDIPLYLKGGIVDNILYRVTMGLCLGGSAYSLYCLGWASFPRN